MSFSTVPRLTSRLSTITHQLTSLTEAATMLAPLAVTAKLTFLFPVHCNHRSFTSAPTPRDQDNEKIDSYTEKGGSGGGISSWVKSKIPFALGGNREEVTQLENLSIDDFREGLKQARRMGALTGFASGTSSASDPAAQGTLRLFENIITAMTPEEKTEAATQFSSSSRERIAAEVGCSVMQVDDCVARYRWMRSMTVRMAQLKKDGKEMPKSIDELEAMLGTWKQHKQLRTTTSAPVSPGLKASSTIGSSSGGIEVPIDAVSRLIKGEASNQLCGLAGQNVGKNTKCPLTKKSYKACCGRR
ncbi:hypothetical protein Ndes2526B_g07604 [Nannochloris sp. 'desiccata']|nr:hypothetical protein NADE_004140 [Chlorella desiccata (nom. nud.)]